jgi:hypothetical protein
MRTDQLERLSDGIHNNLGQGVDGELEPTTNFDYEAVDRALGDEESEEDEQIAFADAATALRVSFSETAFLIFQTPPTSVAHHGQETLPAASLMRHAVLA